MLKVCRKGSLGTSTPIRARIRFRLSSVMRPAASSRAYVTLGSVVISLLLFHRAAGEIRVASSEFKVPRGPTPLGTLNSELATPSPHLPLRRPPLGEGARAFLVVGVLPVLDQDLP